MRVLLLPVKRWRFQALENLTFPVPVTRRRFLALECVFILGIIYPFLTVGKGTAFALVFPNISPKNVDFLLISLFFALLLVFKAVCRLYSGLYRWGCGAGAGI